MAHVKNHDYHILNPSLWPFIGAVAAFVMLFGAVLFFSRKWSLATIDWISWCPVRNVWMVGRHCF